MAAKEASSLPRRSRKSMPSASDCQSTIVFSSNSKPDTFMWIPENNEVKEKTTLHKEKQRFIRTNHHRKRKEKATQPLKTSHQLPSPESSQSPENTSTGAVTKGSRSPIQRASMAHEPIICQSMEWKLLDVFPAPKKPMKNDWNIYFDHFRVYTTSAAYPFSGSSRSIWYFNHAQAHPLLIDVLAASGAFTCAAKLMLLGDSPESIRKCTQDAIQLKHQSVVSLKRVLNNPTNETLGAAISVVANLIHLGMMNHEIRPSRQGQSSEHTSDRGSDAYSESLEMHMTGIKIMINLLGGLDNVDDKLQTAIYDCDIAAAFANDSNLHFRMSPIWEFKVNQQIAAAQKVAKNVCSTPSPLASGLIDSPWFVSLDPRIKSLIYGFKWMISIFEGIVHVSSQFDEANNDYLALCTYQLMSLKNDPFIIPLEETLRLTMVIYGVTRIWMSPPQQSETIIVNALIPSIKETFEQMQKISPGLLFWVLWIGALGSFGRQYQLWFVGHIRGCAKTMGIHSWSEASSVLERFLFVDRGANETGKMLWTSIMQ